jgi:DNA-binding SARP family transcriptional activator/tetratricopeptide (TPR) repeat protein
LPWAHAGQQAHRASPDRYGVAKTVAVKTPGLFVVGTGGQMTVEFQVFGHLAVRINGQPIDIGPARQRAVLATLLTDANQSVSVDQLMERVWAGRGPRRVRESLYSYLSRIRRLLAPAEDVDLVRQSGGYLLTLDPATLDLTRFHQLIDQARAATGDDEALGNFEQALGLWRGEAFVDLDTPWLNGVRDSLRRHRLAAELDRNDIALRHGHHARLLTGLSLWVTTHPLDERLAGQLMLALYRCGRQADAFEHYRRIRWLLAEELGTDPSPILQKLHQQLLCADPILTIGTTVGPGPGAASTPVPRQLPPPPPSFTARSRELAALTTALDDPVRSGAAVAIVSVTGTGGIGKTWLALRWAHDNLNRFPDGQLYVNLRGFDPADEPTPPAAAVRGFLGALGVPPAAIPVGLDAQTALYRSQVAGKRMLVVLDNARDAAQVTPLLPGSPTCAVLITSRQQLAGLVAAYGAHPVALGLLTPTEARELLTQRIGVARLTAGLDSVASILDRCAGLPLALSIVAARLATRPTLPLRTLAEELHEQGTRLDALDAGDVSSNLRAPFGASYRALNPDTARLFRFLALAPGPDISLPAAASLADLPPHRARALMYDLLNASLLQQHTPGRYRFHDLVRLYASERADHDDPQEVRHAALHRLLDHYLHTAHTADRIFSPGRDFITLADPHSGVAPEKFATAEAALGWLQVEHAVLLAAVRQARDAGFHTHAYRLAWALTDYLHRQGHWHEQVAVQQIALDATLRLHDPIQQAHFRRGLARAYSRLGRYADAHTQLQHAIDLFQRLGDHVGQAHSQLNLAFLAEQEQRYAEALRHSQQALDLYLPANHRRGRANALGTIGWYHALLSDHRQALKYCHEALALHQELGNHGGEAATWHSLGHAHHHLGDHHQALTCYQQALGISKLIGDRHHETEVLTRLADVYDALDNPIAGRSALEDAAAILTELRHPDLEDVEAKLRRLDHTSSAAANS